MELFKVKSFTGLFKSGIHAPDRKKDSAERPVRTAPPPEKVYIALSQHIGKSAVPVVKEGDAVKKGRLIAKADGAVSANIFASVSGKVSGIRDLVGTDGMPRPHIIIDNDFKETEEKLPALDHPGAEQIRKRAAEAGIVGLGGAGFPTAVKLESAAGKINAYLINAAECEPYITCDYRALVERAAEVVEGAFLLARAAGVKDVYVGIENNKPAAIEILKKHKAEKELENLHIIPLKTRYPQGAEKQLIYAVLKRKVPSGGLPADAGAAVNNVQTALAVYRAVREGRPLYERIVTVAGGGIKTPGNYLVRNGASYRDIAAAAGGENGLTEKIINGGPMMGAAQISRDISATKTTGALLFLTKDEVNAGKSEACINCGRCAKACPMRLMPMYIDSFCLGEDYSGAKKYGALECIECGCCSYVCPAKRYLLQSIKLAKKAIKERGV